MLRSNGVLSVLALLMISCGGNSSAQPEMPPQNFAPAEEPTGASTPSVGAATVEQSGEAADPGASGAADSTGAQVAQPLGEPLTEGQIALVMELTNQREVEQAKFAQNRAKNPRVKSFATMMVNEHGKAHKEQQKLIVQMGVKPDESPLSSQLATDSKTQLKTLKGADAASFDRTYIDNQVEAHTKVLNALDSQLIPSAKSNELRAELTKARAMIERHLKEARDIQQSLAAAGTPPSGAGTPSSATPAAPHMNH